MNDARSTTGPESTRRLGAERRLTSAVVANYIHERSTRHGEPERRALAGEPPTPPEDDPAPGGCWE